MTKFNQNKYINQYVKDNYIRKEVSVRRVQWFNTVEPKWKKDRISLKQIILDYIDDKLKREEIDE